MTYTGVDGMKRVQPTKGNNRRVGCKKKIKGGHDIELSSLNFEFCCCHPFLILLGPVCVDAHSLLSIPAPSLSKGKSLKEYNRWQFLSSSPSVLSNFVELPAIV